MSDTSNRGGARPGAGRPPTLNKQIKKAEQLARILQLATKEGFVEIGERYGEVIQAALKLALGYTTTKYTKEGVPYEAEVPPDRHMISKIIDIGIGSLDDGEYHGNKNPALDLLERARKRGGDIHLHQHGANEVERPARDVIVVDPITESVRNGPTVDVREHAANGAGRSGGDSDDEPRTDGDHAQ